MTVFPTSLFWRVFVVNAALLTVAVVLLVATPATVSDPATADQLALLVGGLLVLLAANVFLLRVSLRPLRDLTGLMERIDLLRPGQRLDVAGARELTALLAGFNRMLDRLELERRVSSGRQVGREEDERRRLAAELHDQVGQGLTALLLQLKSAIEDAPEPLRGELYEAQAIARENLDEIRRIARRLRPTMLDDLGLAPALDALAGAAQEQTDIAILRNIDPDVPKVPEQAELALYRIAQEALTNAIRHATPTWIELSLAAADGRVRLEVTDDGRGMIYAADVEGGGIRGMRERAITVGAELTINSRPGGGTSVTVSVEA